MKKIWSVWVGGIEVNDYVLDQEEATRLAEMYLYDGYDDVEMTFINV